MKNEFWVMVFSDSRSITASKESKEDAIRFLNEIQEEYPGRFDDAYVARVKIIDIVNP